MLQGQYVKVVSSVALAAGLLSGCSSDKEISGPGSANDASVGKDSSSTDGSSYSDVVVTDASNDAVSDAGTDAGDSSTADVVDAEAEFDASGIVCGDVHCDVGQVCCVEPVNPPIFSCASECPDGGLTIGCDGPEDCSGDADAGDDAGDAGSPMYCCGSLDVPDDPDGGFPACVLAGLATTTTACSNVACNTSVAFSCNVTDTLRLCHAAADCVGSTGLNCCDVESGGTTYATICMDNLIKLGLGGAGYLGACH